MATANPAMAHAAAGAPSLDFVALFAHADLVVQAVMGGLMMASVAGWAIIIALTLRLRRMNRTCDAWESSFWKAGDLAAIRTDGQDIGVPLARVAKAALNEWRLSLAQAPDDRDGIRQRLAAVMGTVVDQEAERAGVRLNVLATIGAVAPFVGLFGTVWGIISSFFQIGQQQNSSLAVVAPGISEALFATAIGLFVAIPAVIAYNHFSHALGHFEARLQRFADRFHARLSRELGRR